MKQTVHSIDKTFDKLDFIEEYIIPICIFDLAFNIFIQTMPIPKAVVRDVIKSNPNDVGRVNATRNQVLIKQPEQKI